MELKLSKTKKLKNIDKDELKLLVEFLKFATAFIKLSEPLSINLLHAAPDESITLGCYRTDNKNIRVVVEGRNLLDYCRTIAHEMVHQRQQSEGRLNGSVQEIGGEIEDEANVMAGRVM